MSKSIKEYMVIWTGDGRVGLQKWPAQGQRLFKGAFESSWGACNMEVQEATFEQCKTMVFINAMHMIVRDKCDPSAVHKVLSELDEYQDGCSDDMLDIAKIRHKL